MDEFEQELRERFDRSRSAYVEAPDPFARINQRARRRQHRRRAFAAFAVGCVAVVAVPAAVVSLRDSSDGNSRVALRWSARARVDAGAGQGAAGTGQPTAPGSQLATPPPNDGSVDTSPGVVAPSATESTVPGSSGSNPVTSPPSGGVAPGGAAPAAPKDEGTKVGGSTDGGTANGAAEDGATPDVSELEVVAPPLASGPASANLGARTAPSCGGPNELAVGEEGVFTAPDKSAEPFAWAPDEPGLFDVVLDGPTGVVCLTPVSVVDVDAGTPEVVSP